jgi:hypothetical protein
MANIVFQNGTHNVQNTVPSQLISLRPTHNSSFMALCKVDFSMEQYAPITCNGLLLYRISTNCIKHFML